MGSSSAAAAEASADLGAKMSSKSHVILSSERFNCEKELNGDCFLVVCFADISKKRPFDLDGKFCLAVHAHGITQKYSFVYSLFSC